MIKVEFLFISIAILLLASILASKAANKLGVPALLLFLLLGMIAGSEGLGGIQFENPLIAKLIGDFALTLILFAGGLDTNWKSIQPVLIKGLTLSTLGVAITMLLLGSFAWFILGSFSSFNIGSQGITWTEGLLLGAIISSTDAAAVFSVLRSSNLGLKGDLQPLLELESGSNDPIAVLLTTEFVRLLSTSEGSLISLGLSLFWQILAGIAFGYGMGKLVILGMNRINLVSPGLYPLAILAWTLLTFGVTTVLGANGFLAVYIAGIVIGNHPRLIHSNSLFSFYDSLSWLMQITMFLTLGLLVFPSQLLSIAGVAIVISLFLMFVARPVSVFICLAFSQVSFSEKLFISWVGLRGSVPIVLATFPLMVGLSEADKLFNIVFFIVLTSALIQGLSLAPVARRLGLVESPST
ncbi:potassium/proton antiporter [Limnoraphis robusta Tam1]|uniref:potassium/proton antiporter n=1 Tax=Limnoraphis robusta TaxID=1118279 RepID=UPI002B2010C5|nr:potassium/proton antiporter [Limnoraphis robusta]MEA5538611.1 potassium/proton antiporter [Limnoraphis robusta Tam1]